MPGSFVLIIVVCIGTSCFQKLDAGWSSKEACLLPVDSLIERSEVNLDSNPAFADEEHKYRWACATSEEFRSGDVKFIGHKTMGGKRV